MEVTIAGGVIAVASLIGAQILKDAQKMKLDAEIRDDINQVISRITGIMSNSRDCKSSLNNKKTDASIHNIKLNGNTVISSSTPYGKNIILNAMKLTNFKVNSALDNAATGATGEGADQGFASLEVEFVTRMSSTTSRTIKKNIPIFLVTSTAGSTGKITDCYMVEEKAGQEEIEKDICLRLKGSYNNSASGTSNDHNCNGVIANLLGDGGPISTNGGNLVQEICIILTGQWNNATNAKHCENRIILCPPGTLIKAIDNVGNVTCN